MLDILIPTYNRRVSLERTIKSIFAAKPAIPFRLTVVDNNSHDGTAELVREMIGHHGSDVLAYLHEGQQGRSHALNAGIAATNHPLVGFIDDDEEIHPDWLSVVQRKFAEPGLDFLGGPYFPIWGGPVPIWLPRSYHGLVGSIPEPTVETPYTADFGGMLMGGNAVIRRETLALVGPYSTAKSILRTGSVLASGTDRDMYARLLRAGAKGLFCPELIIYHHIPASRLTLRYLRQRAYHHGRSRAYHELVGNLPYAGIRWRLGKALRGVPFLVSQRLFGRSEKSTEYELAWLELAGYAMSRIQHEPPRA